MKRKALLIAGVVVALFLVTNPSMRQLKEYRGCDKCEARRTANYLLFSKFEYGQFSYRREVVGVLSNFFEVDNSPETPPPGVSDQLWRRMKEDE